MTSNMIETNALLAGTPEFATATPVFDQVVPAGAPFHHVVRSGQYVRILDLEGNQAADTLFYGVDDPVERFSGPDTIREQGNLFLSTGTKLISNEGNVMLTIVRDLTGRHDTVGGACSAESNTVRYGHHVIYQHACRDNFLNIMTALNLSKRDIVSNINFFMHVPIEPDGRLAIVDGVSAPGKYVDLRAEMDVIIAISNCPQVNNPCNAFNPTPIQVSIWDPPAA
jgi:urea carboxylase-associated protein 1